MDIFIGIDPSMNSSGLCIQFFEEDNKIKEYFVIIKPDKLTKKEQQAQDKYLFFDYILFDKYDLKQYKEENHQHEWFKTLNMISVLDKIVDVIKSNINECSNIYIVQEGISYGSTLRTKSVFDLAGLNFMIRDRIVKLSKGNFFNTFKYIIATPSEIKKWTSGNGNCKKEVMIDMFHILYPDFDLPKLDDVCDAYFMASYGKYLHSQDRL